MGIMQALMGSYGAGDASGPLSLTFLGGREDVNPGRTATLGGTYSNIQFTTPSSFSTNMPSGTSLVVVAIMMEKVRAGYAQATPRLTDNSGTNTWTQILQQHTDTGTSVGGEVVIMACELSALPSTFTVHYRDSNARGINTAWYAVQNYTSTSPVSTDVAFNANGFDNTAASVSLSWTGSGAVCIAAHQDDRENMPSITGGTEDFYTEMRLGGSDNNLTHSAASTLATGTSQSFTRPGGGGSTDTVFAAVAFR